MTTSLLLDQVTWDLVVDVDGNLALASEPYSIAQDVACAIRCFVGDLWFDTTQGIPYFQTILGKLPPLSYLKMVFATAALTVPQVATAVCYIGSFTNRELTGQVIVTLKTGQVVGIGFASQGSLFILGTSILGGGDAL